MKIFVTGANGQLGSELKEASRVKNEWNFIFSDIDKLDLTDFDALETEIADKSPDYIINCAAYTAVDKAEEEQEKALLINAVIPEKLAILSQKYGARLIHISTDYVFTGESHIPIKEDALTAPRSMYGKTKLEGEKRVLKNTSAVIIRTSWLYSRFGNNFVKTMLKLGAEKKTLNVIFDQIGSPTYAFDLANAIITIIEQTTSQNKWEAGIYHYSNQGVCSWYDFACEIMLQAGLNCHVQPIESFEYPLPAPRPHYSVMNNKKIKITFAIEIPHWKKSLTTAIKYLTETHN